jgi:hypothetical protein
MVIFLAGSTELARAAVAAAWCAKKEGWKHLPLESVAQVARSQGIAPEEDDELLLRIAAHCVEALRDDGHPGVLLSNGTVPADEETLAAVLGERCLGVHLGEPEKTAASSFTVRIDPSGRTAAQIGAIIADALPPDA